MDAHIGHAVLWHFSFTSSLNGAPGIGRNGMAALA
jgi:hypothetical protein